MRRNAHRAALSAKRMTEAPEASGSECGNLDPLFDVVAVTLDGRGKRIIANGKTAENAEAIVAMCVMRLGCSREFFTAIPAAQAGEPKP